MSANSTHVSIRLRIPKSYQQQPIVSQLISRYNITVNITAALLVSSTRDGGWFDLELQGTPHQVEEGLNYLQSLNLEIFPLKLKSIFASSVPKNQANSPVYESSELVQGSSSIKNSQLEEKLPMLTEITTRTDIQVSIPIEYRHSPILAALVSHYSLTVNINSAILVADVEESSWFDLELWGHPTQISSGVNYLKQLGSRIWLKSPRRSSKLV
ncbi:MAG: NIL domain-containing protein [Chroococcidiopsidaceae cyanobacterium CP_BM_RX_35]|nr:NIL domain-containing protein [Chroococcidiopsidaceae cyanobacterium CP_BM_RX_35]